MGFISDSAIPLLTSEFHALENEVRKSMTGPHYYCGGQLLYGRGLTTVILWYLIRQIHCGVNQEEIEFPYTPRSVGCAAGWKPSRIPKGSFGLSPVTHWDEGEEGFI